MKLILWGHHALYFEEDKWGNAREYALNLEAEFAAARNKFYI